MNILLATDGSFYSLQAAAFLGSRLNPERVSGLLVVAVAAGDPGRGTGTTGGLPQGVPVAAARRWVDRTLEALEGSRIPLEGEVLQGDPVQTLVNLAESGSFDLVVAGVKGQGAAPFFELGRVAAALKQKVNAPVLLVRPSGSDSSRGWMKGDRISPLRVLLPTDGEGREVVTACRLLGAFRLARGSVEIAALLGGSVALPGERPPARWAGGNRQERRIKARSWLAQTLPALDPWEVVSSSLLEGRPVREIERRVRETGSDLLVLSLAEAGSRGTGATRVAEELAWFAPCSVLLIRDAMAETAPGLSMLLDEGRMQSRMAGRGDRVPDELSLGGSA
jgi:nucleotide-binding universal stress UspA family protein